MAGSLDSSDRIIDDLKRAVKALLGEATLKRCVYIDGATTREVLRCITSVLSLGFIPQRSSFWFSQPKDAFVVFEIIEPLCPESVNAAFVKARLAPNEKKLTVLLQELLLLKFLSESFHFFLHQNCFISVAAHYERHAIMRTAVDLETVCSLLTGLVVLEFSRVPAENMLGSATGNFHATELLQRQRFSGKEVVTTSRVQSADRQQADRDISALILRDGNVDRPRPSDDSRFLQTYIRTSSKDNVSLFGKNNVCCHQPGCTLGYVSLHGPEQSARLHNVVLRFSPYGLIGPTAPSTTAPQQQQPQRHCFEINLNDVATINVHHVHFHKGRPSTGDETQWVFHEHRQAELHDVTGIDEAATAEELVVIVLHDGSRAPELVFLNRGVMQMLQCLHEISPVYKMRGVDVYTFQAAATDLTAGSLSMLGFDESSDPIAAGLVATAPFGKVVPYAATSASVKWSSGHELSDMIDDDDPSRSNSKRRPMDWAEIVTPADNSTLAHLDSAEKLSSMFAHAHRNISRSRHALQQTMCGRAFSAWAKYTKNVCKIREVLRLIMFETDSSGNEPVRHPPKLKPHHLHGLTEKAWLALLDEQGRCLKEDEVRLYVFGGGCAASLRPQIWKFLLGLYSFSSTAAQRANIDESRERSFQAVAGVTRAEVDARCPIKQPTFAATMQMAVDVSDRLVVDEFDEDKGGFGEQLRRIEKDVQRTDRSNIFFSSDNGDNLNRLRHVITIYVHENMEFGYVQGMCDYLAPLLAVMRTEAESFWSFVAVMNQVRGNFDVDQVAMTRQFNDFQKLLEVLDPQLFKHFVEVGADNLLFSYRWLLLMFKREFSYSDLFYVWECIWSNCGGPNFHLFIAMALLDMYREVILDNKMPFESILKFFNEVAEKSDAKAVVHRAQQFVAMSYQILQSEPVHKQTSRSGPH